MRLVTGNADCFHEIGAERMRHWLVIMRVVRYRIKVGIGKGTNEIHFSLQVEVLQTKCIDIFSSYLHTEFISPPAIAGTNFFQQKFIEQQLSVKLKSLRHIGFDINTDQCIVGTAVLLLAGAQENNRV